MNDLFLRFHIFSFFLIIFCQAQNNLTLEDAILKSRTNLAPESLKDLKWNNEQDFFSYQASDTSIYLADFNNVILDSVFLSQLNNSLSGENKLKSIPNITWLNSHSFRFKKDNNYYLYNTKRGNKAVHLFDIEKNASHIDFNKQNTRYAYTIDNNLYIVSDANNHIQVTNDANLGVISGQAVHRYEFGIYKGTFWSNDGNRLAFYRKDESMVTDYPLIDISSRVGHANTIKYPMAGMLSHHVTLGVYNVNTGNTIYLDTGEPKEQYLTNISWGPNDTYIYIAILNRDQNDLKFNQYSAEDGTFIKTLFVEKSDKYVQPLHPMEFVSEDTFLWRSERDGFDKLYLYNTKGRLIKKVLKKDYVIKDFYGYQNNSVYFSTYSNDGLGTDLWEVSLDNNSKKKLISDGSFHHFKISPTKSFFIDQFSNLDIPNIIRIIDSSEGRVISPVLVSDNPLKGYDIGEVNLFSIKTDKNISLNTRLIKPYDFDKNKKYPAVIYVYNGPGVQLIRNNWLASAPLWMYYLANQGYIIFTVDGRGSENRGRDFEQIIFKELGKIEMLDQIKGYNYLIKQDFIDQNRIAVHGWSYGGFMTTNLLLNYPDLFTCGVAGGPVIDWANYEIMYTERYMDHPNDNKSGYKANNLLNQVHLLEDPLLMIHGLMDDVVLPQHSLEFIKAAVDHNVKIDYFIYPGHPHNVRGKDRIHLIEKIIDYIRINNI